MHEAERGVFCHGHANLEVKCSIVFIGIYGRATPEFTGECRYEMVVCGGEAAEEECNVEAADLLFDKNNILVFVDGCGEDKVFNATDLVVPHDYTGCVWTNAKNVHEYK